MYSNTATQTPEVYVGEFRNLAISFVNCLDDGELLTGAPVITEVGTSDLTITNKTINTVALKIANKTVKIGKAVQASISGQLAINSPYTLKIVVTTDAVPAEVLKRKVQFLVPE